MAVNDQDYTTGVANCSHGHSLRRKCGTCDHEDDQTLIAELTRQVDRLQRRLSLLSMDPDSWLWKFDVLDKSPDRVWLTIRRHDGAEAAFDVPADSVRAEVLKILKNDLAGQG